MKNQLIFITSFFVFSLFSTLKAFAMCPVCAVAVGAGVGLSRFLGVDDLITGLWIGALTVSMIMWTINWFNKKNIKFKFKNLVIIIGYLFLIIVPLYFMGIIGYLNPFFLFLDKLSVGIILGSFVFWGMAVWYLHLKEKNGGHAYFPFQKVAMPVGSLIVLSFIIYLLLK